MSLDIVAGALVSSLYFFRLTKVRPSFLYWPLLALVVWLIYLSDHLADSLSSLNRLNNRLQFFRTNRKLVLTLLGLTVVSIAILLFFVPADYFLFGIPGGVLVILYVFLNQIQARKNVYFFPREIIIALFYTYGICGLPLLLSVGELKMPLLFALVYFLLILTNVLIYSWFEYGSDVENHVQTFAVKFGRPQTRLAGLIVNSLAFLLSLLLFKFSDQSFLFVAILLTISVGYFAILFGYKFFEKHNAYGLAADGLLLLAALSMLV